MARRRAKGLAPPRLCDERPSRRAPQPRSLANPLTSRGPVVCSASYPSGEGTVIGRPASQIANGDFEQGLASWRVVSGTAFAGQPVQAATLGAADVEYDGQPLVPLGGDFWHTPFPLGHSGAWLIRVITTADGVLDSTPFAIGARYLAFRLGGSSGGAVAVHLRLRQNVAQTLGLPALDPPDADGFVAVRIANPDGGDPLKEIVWDLAPRHAPSLIGAIGKVSLVVRQASAPQRLLVDDIRLSKARPKPFHRTPLWGWADIHCHPMAQAGFGGLLAGHMHGPVEDLGTCLPAHGHQHGNPTKLVAMNIGMGKPNDGSLAVPGWTTGTPAPEDQLAFRGWPSFSDLSHIKTHQVWLRRAYEGGQRLMVALVVHNSMLAALANLGTPGYGPQSDRDAVEPQVQMLREFVAHNLSWCGIATTPADARSLIEANKMAFVLGLETDSVNGWIRFDDFPQTDTPASRDAIHTAIHDYFAYLRGLGIVQVNLLHLSDNAFGGMAVYDFMFIVNSLYNRGVVPQTKPWTGTNPDELIAKPVSVGSEVWSMISSTATQLGITIPPAAAPGPFGIGDTNANGLTVAGQVALLEAMRLGMVVDIDHMSERSEATAFQMATTTVAGTKYPLVAAHNAARILAPRPLSPTSPATVGSRRSKEVWPSEGMKSETHLDHIKTTGGMFGLGIAGADSRTAPGSMVDNNLPGTSRTVAQGYQYLHGRLEMPVALGTDWNALLAGPGPRFGPLAGSGILGELAEGDSTWQAGVRAERWQGAQAQTDGVRYDTPLSEWRTFRFEDPGLFVGTPLEGLGHQVWQALALIDAGADLTSAEVVAALTPAGSTTPAPTLQLALGLSGAAGTSPNPMPIGVDLARAAFLAANPGAATSSDRSDVVALATAIGVVLTLWAGMHASTAPAMHRDTVGPMRDFDFNIDGLAHYGLMPDMLQDLRNVGLDAGALAALFQSAERYVSVWEHCVATGAMIPH